MTNNCSCYTFKDTALYLGNKLGAIRPECLVILGSGLNNVLEDINTLYTFRYKDITGIPGSSVSGHKGILQFCEYEGQVIAIMRGRLHIYEGYHCDDVVRLPRAIAFLGAKTAFITNAAGSTSVQNRPGDIVLINDHINTTGLSPLGSDEARMIGEQFIDMGQAYSRELGSDILKAARKNSIKLKQGVYAWTRGPQYETAAEIRALKKMGVSVVGMSTVPEVIALHQMGTRIACVSSVTNFCTGVRKDHTLSHEEVKENGKKVSQKLDGIIRISLDFLSVQKTQG
ncbi:MAG: purine-nucleoside phosphorylase [Oligoflexia bacterium]|nr:purine-nucleoside phosphorylase [Oligoflexia bacterium]